MKWIDNAKKKPPREGRYLVYNQWPGLQPDITTDRYTHRYEDGWTLNDVTHWMPLPKPPRNRKK